MLKFMLVQLKLVIQQKMRIKLLQTSLPMDSRRLHNMTTIIIFSLIGVAAIAGFLILLESFLNRNDEFIEVKEWHNFRNSFNQTNKGEK